MRTVEFLMKNELGRIWKRDRCFERTIRLYGNQDQRTDAWLSKRGTMITASEVTKVWTTPASRLELMTNKLDPPPRNTGANPIAPLIWGTRFEAVAKRIFEETTNCKVIDVGCCTHPVHSFLGASPDGLIVPNDDTDRMRYGRLVEFKCPMSRKETPGIPDAYVNQMQMQMECTGVDECEYVEYRFKQVFFTEWDTATQQKGCFAVDEKEKVIYKPDDVTLDDWRAGLDETQQYIYWILTGVKKDFVPWDPNWLPSHSADLKAFWDEVVRHRAEGTKPQPLPSKVMMIDL
jgi:putative phage-type endonuclease